MSSQIAALEFARYRGFRDQSKVDLSRLTLIYGPNNAGKSALVRIPPLLAASRTPGRPGLNLDTSVFRGAGFRDIKWRGALPTEADSYLVLGAHLSDGTQWRWTFDWLDSKSTSVIQTVQVVRGGTTESFELAPLGHRALKDAEYFTAEGTRRIAMDGLLPRETVGGLVEESREALSQALDAVTWLGTLRKGPMREGSPRGATGSLVGDGEGAAALVLADKALRLRVSDWFLAHTGYNVESEALGPDLERLVLRPTDRHDVPFPDAGEGLQQVFPVVVALEQLHQSGGLLTIEEPESHLHPRLQRALADRMVSVLVEQPLAKIVLETHSEIFLLASLRAANKALLNQVGVFWVETDVRGASTLESIPLDLSGRPTTPRLEEAFATMGVMRRELLADRKANEGR